VHFTGSQEPIHNNSQVIPNPQVLFQPTLTGLIITNTILLQRVCLYHLVLEHEILQ
jgi:hypothetical protein